MDETPQTPPPGGLAAHLAMNGKLPEEARDYLREQIKLSREQIELTRLQKQNLIELNAFELSHLRWRRFNEFLRGVLQILFVLTGVLLLAGIGMAIWNAANDRGLTIEAFNVPQDFAQKGLTGEVVANKLLDRLSDFQRQTSSNRAASSYANNWGNDIKVQIPNTGISIGEANRYLHRWFGSGTLISGDVYRTGPGKIAVVARAGTVTSPAFIGNDADLDKLITRAAEAVYRVTQPYRYGNYLSRHGRSKEAVAIYRDLIENGPTVEKIWGHIGLRFEAGIQNRTDIAAREMYAAIALKPDFAIAWVNLATDEAGLQHEEAALKAARTALKLDNSDGSVSPNRMASYRQFSQSTVTAYLGDGMGTERAIREAIRVSPAKDSANIEQEHEALLGICGSLHDESCLRNAAASLDAIKNPPSGLFRRAALAGAWIAMGRYADAGPVLKQLVAEAAHDPSVAGEFLSLDVYPLLAVASAQMGGFKAAHRWIDKTPLDCSPCLRNRGTIAGLEKNGKGADYWFERAVKIAPSIPFNETDWGAMLMAKGDFDGAIAKFQTANRKGPHFADPLEMWGEALIAKNRSDLALAKFAEAAKYAPNWGRLHLKWGEALLWSGDKDGARTQFATVRGLYLSDAEKREAATMSKAV